MVEIKFKNFIRLRVCGSEKNRLFCKKYKREAMVLIN